MKEMCPGCGVPQDECCVGWFEGEGPDGLPSMIADWFDGPPCSFREQLLLNRHGSVLIYENGEVREVPSIPR